MVCPEIFSQHLGPGVEVTKFVVPLSRVVPYTRWPPLFIEGVLLLASLLLPISVYGAASRTIGQ